ncbi:MAG: sensor hybrid histidine kinase [Lacunisphaera sp.]|nr:sensor hybrid histidine kinase [Lacunisphaera sp.]
MQSQSRSSTFFNHRAALLVVVGAGAVVALWSFLDSRQRDYERAREEFIRRTTIRHTLTREVLGRYEDALFGLAALFMLDGNVSPAEFERVARRLEEHTPGAQALEWAPWVTAAERPGLEVMLARHYAPVPFEFFERDATGQHHRAGKRAAYLPVTYVHPVAGNETVLGFDFLSGSARGLLDQARATGKIVVTPQVRLVQPANQLGIIMAQPVSRPTAAGGTSEFVGFVEVVFRTHDLLERLRTAHPDMILDMLFVDAGQTDPALRVLYYRPADDDAPRDVPPTEAAFAGGLSQELSIPIGGRDWRVLYRPRAGWLEEQITPLAWIRTAGVLVITLLLGGLIQVLERRTQTIEREVAARTGELRNAQKLLEEDIRQRALAESELQENRRQLSNLISQLPGAAFRCRFDENLTALFASEGMHSLTGYPAADFVAGRIHVAQLTVPSDRPAVRAAVGKALQERRPFEVEYRLTHRDGREKWVLVRGQPIYDEAGAFRFIEGLAIDVTALKLAEQEKIAIERKLLAAQKLESLGVLAGGIAHDFNNILTSVLANASLARRDAEGHGPLSRSLEQIEHAARRAADLCQQMLAYAGKGTIVTDQVEVSELIRGTTALLEVTISKNTRLELQLADHVPPVLADVTQLRQIVMNLVINAADAIGQQPGTITVRTFAQPANAELLRSALGQPDLPAGTYVGLEVRDTGCGMAPATIARIFEPFFTTKFSGRGLGLSAVLGIVQSHRGALFVESALGAGSAFRLLLPAMQDPPASTPAAPTATSVPIPLRGTVLVIDDEGAIRAVAAAVLEAHGATVLEAANGDEALTVLREHGGKISLVLLDMTMPGIGGEETLRRMRLANFRPAVIMMSGYSEAETMQRSASLGAIGFVQKPFELQALLAKVRPFLV